MFSKSRSDLIVLHNQAVSKINEMKQANNVLVTYISDVLFLTKKIQLSNPESFEAGLYNHHLKTLLNNPPKAVLNELQKSDLYTVQEKIIAGFWQDDLPS